MLDIYPYKDGLRLIRGLMCVCASFVVNFRASFEEIKKYFKYTENDDVIKIFQKINALVGVASYNAKTAVHTRYAIDNQEFKLKVDDAVLDEETFTCVITLTLKNERATIPLRVLLMKPDSYTIKNDIMEEVLIERVAE